MAWHRPVERVVVFAGGVLALGASAAMALSWIDRDDDRTCSSVVHPGVWWGTTGCRGVMLGRAVVALVLGAAGVVLVLAGVRARPRSSRIVAIAAVLVGLAAIAALVINEAVRPQGPI